jgi:hypothetical protein
MRGVLLAKVLEQVGHGGPRRYGGASMDVSRLMNHARVMCGRLNDGA